MSLTTDAASNPASASTLRRLVCELPDSRSKAVCKSSHYRWYCSDTVVYATVVLVTINVSSELFRLLLIIN